MKRWVTVAGSCLLIAIGLMIGIACVWRAWKAIPAQCEMPPKGVTELLMERTANCAASCRAAGTTLKSYNDGAWGTQICECQPCGSQP